jgi:hypothetical protein
MRKFFTPVLLGLFLLAWTGASFAENRTTRPADYVGNVYGNVTDAATGAPIVGAEVTLLDKPLGRTRAEGVLTPSNKGGVVLPGKTIVSRWRALTDDTGEFLLAGVATPFPYKSYTVIATAPGYDSVVLNYIPVFPGAVMALKVRFALTKEKTEATVFDSTDESAPFQYGDDANYMGVTPSREEVMRLRPESLNSKIESTSSSLTLTVYATQEGLIGKQTYNGHVIQAGDNFVALPSYRAQCSLNGHEFQVQVTYKNKTIVAPVWDAGPYNERDDYWDPNIIRDLYSDLPFGVPEAQAAFQNGYNGKRGSHQVVASPAGIDLGPATATALGLKKLESQWMTVTYLWTTGHADFSISSPAASFAVALGSSISIPVTFSSIDGFSADITPSASALPSGSSASFSSATFGPPLNGRVSGNLTVRTTSATPVGTYSIKVLGTVGRSVKTTGVSLTVTPPPLSASSNCQPAAISLGGTVTCRVTAVGGVPPYRFSINGQAFSQPQVSTQASASIRPSQSGAIVSVVKDSANQQAQTSSQVQVYGALTASCSANPNPARVNNTITWRAQATGGSGSFSYRWLNGTTTPSYSKSYPTAQSVSNWVVITDTVLNQSQTGNCSLTVTK